MQFLINELREMNEALEIQFNEYHERIHSNVTARAKIIRFLAEEEGKQFNEKEFIENELNIHVQLPSI